MQHIERTGWVEEVIRRLKHSPVVALLGARQVGKTTLAHEVAQCWKGTVTSFDLEKARDRELMETSPELALTDCTGLVILDEVQRIPVLFERLRPICDAPNRKAVFLLLGSASFDIVRGISESLAGRIQFVDLAGLSLREVTDAQQDRLWF